MRAQPRERARGIGQRGVVDVGVGRFACCRVVLAELITDGHGVGRALPRAAVGQPGAAHGAIRAVGHDGVFVQVERLLGRELHVEVVAAFGLIADVCVGEVLERHGQLRRVARGARFVAVEHLLDLRQTRARVGERVFAHQHLAVRELVGQLQTGDAGVVRDLFALRHDGAVDVLHGLNVLRLGERGVVTVADDAHAFDLRGIRDAAGVAREVALCADYDEAAHGRCDRAAAPDRARHAQGFADDHLADDKAERRTKNGQQQKRRQLRPVGRHVEQHAVHADRQRQPGEERHDILQHRLEHRDGDGVARALHAAAPVELTRAHEQQQRERRPDERIGPAGEAADGGLCLRAADRTQQVVSADTCAPHEQHQRGEPVDRQIHHARHAVHEHVEHGFDEQLEAHGDEVHEQVQARQHDHVAGEHGAQHGDAVEHDRLEREYAQPDEQRLDDESETRGLNEHGEAEDHGLG